MAGVDITGGGAPLSLSKDIYVNNSLIGAFDATDDVDVFLEDTGGNTITPVSSVLVGNDLTIQLPISTGVEFQFPLPSQYTSYATGDTGWRFQNGFYNITRPQYPQAYAKLDFTAGAASWYRLATPLRVAGVSNNLRFVDVFGGQTFSAVGNTNQVVIDKLTGIMFLRQYNSPSFNWTNTLNNALSYSITVNSVVYDDWYLMGMGDIMSVFGNQFIKNVVGGGFFDPLSLINLCSFSNTFWTSDGATDNTSNAYIFNTYTLGSLIATSNKSNSYSGFTPYMRDARNLISV